MLLTVLATPVAWWLSQGRDIVRDVVGAVVALPIVLPPTVLGFYLLVAMGPPRPLKMLFQPLGIRTLNFSFAGLVVGSLVYSLPFAVRPIRNAFEAVGRRPLEVASTLGASPWDSFWSVAIPLARKGFVTAAILVFAHTVGEFGVVMMTGGSIRGKTEVISTRIFQAVETNNWSDAHVLSAGLVAFAFVVVLSLLVLDRAKTKGKA